MAAFKGCLALAPNDSLPFLHHATCRKNTTQNAKGNADERHSATSEKVVFGDIPREKGRTGRTKKHGSASDYLCMTRAIPDGTR